MIERFLFEWGKPGSSLTGAFLSACVSGQLWVGGGRGGLLIAKGILPLLKRKRCDVGEKGKVYIGKDQWEVRSLGIAEKGVTVGKKTQQKRGA